MAKQVYHIVGEQGVGKTILARTIAAGLEAQGLTVALLDGGCDVASYRASYSGSKTPKHYREIEVDAVVTTTDTHGNPEICYPGERVINLSLVK